MSLESSSLVSGRVAKKTNSMVKDAFPPSMSIVDLTSSAGPEPVSLTHPCYMKSCLPRQLFTCTCLSIFGWYAPSKLRSVIGMTMKKIPYQALDSGDIILDQSLNYPLVDNVTIPSNLLFHSSVTLPLLLLATIAITRPRVKPKYYDIHSGLCMVLMCITMAQFSTSMMKMYVGRLRPNFYDLCSFDSAKLECTAEESLILDARRSFPSGHSALSFAGMGCLVWFFLGRSRIGKVSNKRNYGEEKGIKRQLYDKRWTDNKLQTLAAFLPLMYSSFVACSRLVDNWHHPSDILAGSLIGIFSSTLVYHLWYPNIFSPNAGIPLSWLVQNNGMEYENIPN